jgi:hypothetical protein
MPDDTITLETSLNHTLLDRRSVLTIVLQGGDLSAREATATAIMAQLAPQYSAGAPPRPAELGAVFTLLAKTTAPTTDQLGSDLALPAHAVAARPPHAEPTESTSPYDDVFVLAPLR